MQICTFPCVINNVVKIGRQFKETTLSQLSKKCKGKPMVVEAFYVKNDS